MANPFKTVEDYEYEIARLSKELRIDEGNYKNAKADYDRLRKEHPAYAETEMYDNEKIDNLGDWVAILDKSIPKLRQKINALGAEMMYLKTKDGAK